MYMTVRKIDDYLTFSIASEISNSSNKLQWWFWIFSFLPGACCELAAIRDVNIIESWPRITNKLRI